MAWNHNARNKSAESRKVNYHEDGTDNKMHGDLNPLGKAVVGGLLLFCLARAGFDWVGELIDTVNGTAENIQNAGEIIDSIGKNNSTNSQFNGKLNAQGFTVDFDINNIGATDVQEMLQYLHDNLFTDPAAKTDDSNLIYLSTEVFESNANYEAAVINRLSSLTEPVIFIITYSNISESDKNTIYENAKTIVQANNSLNNSIFTNVKLDALYGAPSDKDLTIILQFSTN